MWPEPHGRQKGRRETAFLSCDSLQVCSQVSMILRPALRFLTRPFPLVVFAARFLAAVILPPRLFLAMMCPPLACDMRYLHVHASTQRTTRPQWQFREEKSIRKCLGLLCRGHGAATPLAFPWPDPLRRRRHPAGLDGRVSWPRLGQRAGFDTAESGGRSMLLGDGPLVHLDLPLPLHSVGVLTGHPATVRASPVHARVTARAL